MLEQIFILPPLNLAIGFYKLFEFLHFPFPLAFAILALTVVIRLIIWPLSGKQLHQTKKMAELKPHLDDLKKKHGHDKALHAKKQSELYKEHGINPASGCLTLLIQMPIFFSLYQVLTRLVSTSSHADVVSSINSVLYFNFLHLSKPLDASFLGVELFTKPSDWQSAGWLLLSVPIITAVFQLVQSKMALPPASGKPKQKNIKKTQEKEDLASSFAQAQSQMLFLLPLLIGYFSYTLPLGLSLYWNTFSLFGIIQQYLISGWGSLVDWLPALKKYNYGKK